VAATVFNDDNIKQFAEAWFYALDIHASTEACEHFLAGDELKMIFPEQTLHGIGDFRAWYAGGTYSDGSTAPGVMNIFFDEIHTLQSVAVTMSGDTAVADVVVGWQASWFTPPAAKSKRTSMDATQQWHLRACSKDKNPYGLEIISYNAMSEPFKYAPGFSRL
jgi:hypothetical protein